jgi:hypothetical protein
VDSEPEPPGRSSMPCKVAIVTEDSMIEPRREFDLIDETLNFLEQNLGHTVGRKNVESIHIDIVK